MRSGLIDRGYTDTAAIIGPNMRWAQEDAKVLLEQTTAFLGYNILVLTPGSLHRVRGHHLSKVVIVGDGKVRRQDASALIAALSWSEFPHVEHWDAHPVTGPRRIS